MDTKPTMMMMMRLLCKNLSSLTSVLNQNHFKFRLDDSMANVFVYGVAMAADDVFANQS